MVRIRDCIAQNPQCSDISWMHRYSDKCQSSNYLSNEETRNSAYFSATSYKSGLQTPPTNDRWQLRLF